MRTHEPSCPDEGLRVFWVLAVDQLGHLDEAASWRWRRIGCAGVRVCVERRQKLKTSTYSTSTSGVAANDSVKSIEISIRGLRRLSTPRLAPAVRR